MRLFLRDIWKYRKYMIRAAKAELRSEVTNAYLDWFWWVLEPVCNMLIYYLIFGIVFLNSERYYLVFIYSSITMWTFFQKTMVSSVQLIRDSKAIITKVYLPKPVLLLEKMVLNAFKMAISAVIVVVLMLPYRVPVDAHLAGLIPVLCVFFLFTYGCGCILMHFGVYVSDLAYIVSIVLNMLFYFTGIFYSVRDCIPAPWGSVFEAMNPLAFLIAQMRNALIYQNPVAVRGMLCWLVGALILAMLGSRIVYRYENTYVKVI